MLIIREMRIKAKLKTGQLTEVQKTKVSFIGEGITGYLWLRRNQAHLIKKLARLH
jgi:hypothetical protein